MHYTALHNDFNTPNLPVKSWPLLDKINFFYTYIDYWHLKVADRCINGWKDDNGNDCINCKDLQGRSANYIPDSGFAVLQITLNYFEVIGFFKTGKRTNKKAVSFEFFKLGFYDVFPQLKTCPTDIARIFWKALRVTLYHDGVVNDEFKGRVVLSRSIYPQAIAYETDLETLIIDPHEFVPTLRVHLKQYCMLLQDLNDASTIEIFETAFCERFG